MNTASHHALFAIIESAKFQAEISFAVGASKDSGARTLVERFIASPEIDALRRQCQQDRTIWSELWHRTENLTQESEIAPDGSAYRHPHDITLAVYAWVLWATDRSALRTVRRLLSPAQNLRQALWVLDLLHDRSKLHWLRIGDGRWASTCGRYTVWRQAQIRHGGTEWAAQYEDEMPWLITQAGSVAEAKGIAVDHARKLGPETLVPGPRAACKPRPGSDRARRLAAHELEATTQATAKTAEWAYTAHVSPVLITDDNDDWNIQIRGEHASGRTRGESFDIATARAYHALLTEVLRKFDEGEIKNPW